MEPEFHLDRSEMNVIFVHSLLDDWDLTPEAFRVAGHIARRTDGGKSPKSPGRESMMRVTRLTKLKLTDALDELEYCRILHIDRRDGRVNRYSLLPQSKWRRKVPGDEWKYTTLLRRKREASGLECSTENDDNQGEKVTRSGNNPGQEITLPPGSQNDKNQGHFRATKVIQEGNPMKVLLSGSVDPSADTPPPVVPQPAPRPPDKSPPRRNVAFDALAEIDGADRETMTKVEGSRIGKCLADIRSAWPTKWDKDTPQERKLAYEAELAEEIRRRAARYRSEVMPHAQLTATALVAHWSKCAPRVAAIGQPLPSQGGRWALPDGCDFHAIAQTLGLRIQFDTPWHDVSHAFKAQILETHAASGLIS
jgi:hypothetical protein